MRYTDYARMVIMVGIPYPAFKDLLVVAKKKYQDKWCAKDRVHLSGDAWYSQQAFNQAIGRCIRHRLDHGAIILADPRFASNRSVQQNLSKWVRNQVSNTLYIVTIRFAVTLYSSDAVHCVCCSGVSVCYRDVHSM
jgi:Rad3-related DNA helicase